MKKITIYKNGSELRTERGILSKLIDYISKLNEYDKQNSYTYKVEGKSFFNWGKYIQK